jgi:hypothetical protein
MDKRLFKADLQLPVEMIIQEKVPAMIETVIGNMVPHFIEAAVLKGQIELIATIRHRMIMDISKNTSSYSSHISTWRDIEVELKQQLERAATTEVECIHNFVEYRAQGIGIPMRMCTICGETQ